MLDEPGTAVLRGFDIAIADIGDRLRFCQPVVSFKGDSTLYVARRLDWQDDPKILAVTDPAEATELGTLLPDTSQSIASGEGVIAVGTGFVQAAALAGVELDRASFLSIDGGKCWIGIATPERFANLKARLTDEARTAFDEALGEAAHRGRRLSERGNAALLILRKCGPRRRDDLAIRQLAGTRQNDDFDLYRRLLVRFALELNAEENDLHEKVERHIELAAKLRRRAETDPSPDQEYNWAVSPGAYKVRPFVGDNMTKRKTYSFSHNIIIKRDNASKELLNALKDKFQKNDEFREYIYENVNDVFLKSLRNALTPAFPCSKMATEVSSSKIVLLFHENPPASKIGAIKIRR